MRLLLDTNVLISAYFWHGNERRLLWECILGNHECFVSGYILDEMQVVLVRKFNLPEGSVKRYSSLIQRFIKVVKAEKDPNISCDRKDNPVIWACVKAKVDLLVTGDKDLLFLIYKKMKLCVDAHCFKVLPVKEVLK
ncbi:putative toxin-antitoxin system toxin component, PIN family [Thermococcus sp. Bubb.Bath]|uniref:putative toxin-antitoxin system toxin component, PIN family n=1 Tax=Thermococcus sp. Bubb.Bath TaxID=1638242 RepID=UPI00143C5873|nr:putative toxin-antitoxin system toxin component, PIN family [Thermococcus sp. Bubb.Bath]